MSERPLEDLDQGERVGYMYRGPMGWRVNLRERLGLRISPPELMSYRDVHAWAISHGGTMYQTAFPKAELAGKPSTKVYVAPYGSVYHEDERCPVLLRGKVALPRTRFLLSPRFRPFQDCRLEN